MIDKAQLLEDLKIETEETNEAVLNLMMKKAEQEIMNYCRIDEVPVALVTALADLAVYKYEIRGLGHLKSKSLGSTAETYLEDIPVTIKRQLNRFRVVEVW